MKTPLWMPYLLGGTDVNRVGTAYVRGSTRKNSVGEVPGLVVPADLVIETNANAGAPATITLTSTVMADIVTQVNNTLRLSNIGAAEERSGCLYIMSSTSGAESWIRIHPATNDYNADNIPDDAATQLGIPRYPEQGSEVHGFDPTPAALRPRDEANGIATAFISYGEERTASAINRGLARVAANVDDINRTYKRDGVVTHFVELNFSWARMHADGDGYIDQVDLTDLGDDDSTFRGAVYVGGLGAQSSLNEISAYWAVTDRLGQPIYVWCDDDWRPVCVAAVTYGVNGGSPPQFSDLYSSPSISLSDASGTTPDGGNLLGVSRTKISGTITSIRQGMVVCIDTLEDGAGFVSAGVVAGDLVDIIGAALLGDLDNSGTWRVETVISERELALAPLEDTQLFGLETDTGGSLGDMQVRSNGRFEAAAAVTFYPPLPAEPANGVVLWFGRSATPAEAVDLDTHPQFETSLLETDRRLKNAETLQGTYDGRGNGMGGRVATSYAPIDITAGASQITALGANIVSGEVGTILASNVLVSESYTFSPEHVGSLAYLVGTAVTGAVCYIEEVLDPRHVLLRVPAWMSGNLTEEAVEFGLYQASAIGVQGAVQVVRPSGTYAPAFVIVDEEHTSSTDAPIRVPGLLHLSRIRWMTEGSPVARQTCEVVAFPGGTSLELDFDTEVSSALRTTTSSTTRGQHGYQAPTVVQILTGPQAGFYRLRALNGVSARIQLEHLDGSPAPTFTDPGHAVSVAFYRTVAGSSIGLKGNDQAGSNLAKAGMAVFQEGVELGLEFACGVWVGWSGEGAGLYARLNDANFSSYDNGDGASGYAVDIAAYAPGHGASFRVYGANSGPTTRRSARGLSVSAQGYRHDYSLTVPAEIASFGGWFHQGGSDPALIVTRGSSQNAGDFAPYDIPIEGSPAVYILNEESPSFARPAVQIDGVVYVEARTDNGAGGLEGAGGIFTEGSIGAGDFLYPINRPAVDPTTMTYDGSGSAGVMTRLGSPGQILPAAGGTRSATFTTATYARFNYPHDGVVSFVYSGGLFNAWSLGLGFVVEGVSGANDGLSWTIVGYKYSSGRVYLALRHHAGTAPTAETANIRILGKRWYASHIDAADWMEIGTLLSGTPPVLTAAEPSSESQYVQSSSDINPEGLMSPPAWPAGNDGVGLGSSTALADMPHVAVDSASYAGGWARDTLQPRTPFPNDGVLSGGGPDGAAPHGNLATAGSTSTLSFEDFEVTTFLGAGGTGWGSGWSPLWGGCLFITYNSMAFGSLSSGIVRVYRRGEHDVPIAAVSLQVKMIVAWEGGRDVTVTVYARNAGEVFASQEVTLVSQPEPVEISVTFDLRTLVNAASGEIENTRADLLTAMDIPLEDYESIYILQWVSQIANNTAQLVGGADVIGTMRASSLRYRSPVRGHITVGPGDVRLYSDTEYANLYGVSLTNPLTTSRSYGVQEGRNVGLIDAADDGNFYRPTFQLERYFQVGRNSATITAYHPFFDPFWYAAETVATNVVPDRFVPPGYTGFLIPLDIPHGARITDVHTALSFTPCYEGQSGSVTANFMVWTEFPEVDGIVDWFDKSWWDEKEGYILRLIRHNQLFFGKAEELTYTGTETTSVGYSEVIWEETISLADVTEPAFESNEASADAHGGAGHFFQSEHMSRVHRDVYSAATNDAQRTKLIADRRHYAYSLEIVFYTGPRVDDGSGSYGVASVNPMAEISVSSGSSFMGEYVPYPSTQVSTPFPLRTVVRPPVIKMRGARVGYVTDRPGEGGWGG